MIELVNHAPAIDVDDAEYARLLGYPRNWAMGDRARELAEQARAWYAQHGQPWAYARVSERVELENGSVAIDGVPFHSRRLRDMLRQSEAHGVVLVAVSAGEELELKAQNLWHEEKPDEYFFLEVFGSAVVEHLATMAGAQLCAWAEDDRMAVLPHDSPGYPEWDVAEQPRLLELIKRPGRAPLRGELTAMDSGMLRPKKSLLAVFGVTRALNRVRDLRQLTPCENCSYAGCQYRRAPYVRPPLYSQNETMQRADSTVSAVLAELPAAEPLDLQAEYAVNAKALARWARDRLTLAQNSNGTIDAHFRYEGTTCTNMGRPLAFDYRVTLGPRDEGYPIHDHRCAPTPGSPGYQSMCRYLEEGDDLLRTIAAQQPLAGQRLDEVLAWQRPSCSAGCYCDAESRTHKWGLVLETIHYALVQLEKQDAAAPMQEASR